MNIRSLKCPECNASLNKFDWGTIMLKRKTLITSLALAVGLIAAPVRASEQSTIDLESMSLEELVKLRDKINVKIAGLGGDNILPQGTYEVGKDIKAGQYKVMGCEGYDMSCFNIYSTKEDWNATENGIRGTVTYEDGTSAIMNIDDGDYLDITWGSLVVEEIKASWMPESDKTEVPVEQTGIRPEVKEAIDSYETFMNSYCDFMTKYAESDDATSMLDDYTDYMNKYIDATKKFSDLEGDLNDEEIKYYVEVQTRVSQKLTNAAIDIN